MPGMRAGRLVSNSGRAVALGSRSSSLTPLRNWVRDRPGPAVIEPSDWISRLPYQRSPWRAVGLTPHDAVGQELLPPVAYAPVLADIGTGTWPGACVLAPAESPLRWHGLVPLQRSWRSGGSGRLRSPG